MSKIYDLGNGYTARKVGARTLVYLGLSFCMAVSGMAGARAWVADRLRNAVPAV
jgi:hypothetical protein